MLQEIKVDICQKENTTDSNHFARDRRSVFGTQRRDIRGTNNYNSEEPFDFELIRVDRVDRFFQSYRIPRRANLLEDFSPDE